MTRTLQGKRLYFSADDPCPACGKRSYSRVMVLNRTLGIWTYVDAVCTSADCNPSMRGSIPDSILHGKTLFFPDCFQVSLDLCPYCRTSQMISIDRGANTVAVECPGCDIVYAPRFSVDHWLAPHEPEFSEIPDVDVLDCADDESGIRSKSPVPPNPAASGR